MYPHEHPVNIVLFISYSFLHVYRQVRTIDWRKLQLKSSPLPCNEYLVKLVMLCVNSCRVTCI